MLIHFHGANDEPWDGMDLKKPDGVNHMGIFEDFLLSSLECQWKLVSEDWPFDRHDQKFRSAIFDGEAGVCFFGEQSRSLEKLN